ncbi:hypothetical protein FEF26_11505 [Nesterenkonia salmonea]|uniref:Transposase n=1 Tax=Nesterenkonia salmonea TaxID=1804987 RepID=A0A5R9BA70_9MICC|nr:hypothetical protein FEF26_11505 [Nesterenkonia salmonea]
MTNKIKRHTPEQIIRKLQVAEQMLAEGHDVAAVARELAVNEATYFREKNQYGGLKADDAKRLKDLEKQNDRLKKLLAEAELEKAALKELAEGRLLSPTRRCEAVRQLITKFQTSERIVTRLAEFSRPAYRRPLQAQTAADLRHWLCDCAKQHSRRGFRRAYNRAKRLRG